jgi:hypothetical protein
MRPPDRYELRAAVWTLQAVTVATRQARKGLDKIDVPPPPRLPAHADRGMRAVLRRRRDTCLIRAVVRQAWYARRGEAREVVIGVRGSESEDGFGAHAWLEGDDVSQSEGFAELVRLPVRSTIR